MEGYEGSMYEDDTTLTQEVRPNCIRSVSSVVDDYAERTDFGLCDRRSTLQDYWTTISAFFT